MIIVQLLGGLGNQMFQYAIGRQLAILNESDLRLDTSVLKDWRPGKHAVNRDFDLDIFTLTPVMADKKQISRYHSTLMTVPEKVLFKIRQKTGGNLPLTRERHFHFDPSILSLKGDTYLSGNWQSYKYFQSIGDVIRQDFSFVSPLSEPAVQLAKRIRQVPSVCINVRRTDYISVAVTAQAMGAIGLDYYREALKKMKECIGDFEAFIFSDDIEWCRENLNFIEQPAFFVDHRYAGKKFSDYLQLMTNCNHYIIPNSTFAWWGAWLNANSSKKVIAPVKWMNDSAINTADLIPNDWIRL